MAGTNVKMVAAAMNGNHDAYGSLVRNYTGFVYSMALRMTGNHHTAEDLCQEIFLKCWVKLRNLNDPAAFPGWLATTARRTCLNEVDKRSRRMELGEEESSLENLNPTLPGTWDASRLILERAIARLPLQERELVTLCYFDELSSTEVSEITGIPSGTVRVYLHRARKKLKELLEESEDELLG